jgi:uncharacterized membrane protein (UPF0127 family)
MVKQLLLPIAAVAIFIVLVGVFIQKSPSINWSKYFPVATSVQEKTVTVGGKTLQVEIANTETLREKGLSGKTSLPTENGMLFVFDSKKVNPIFWMKGMLIPLDMIWIADGKIVGIDKNIPAPSANTPDDNLSKFNAAQPIDYVLEVNAGFTSNNGVKVGDSVDLSKI